MNNSEKVKQARIAFCKYGIREHMQGPDQPRAIIGVLRILEAEKLITYTVEQGWRMTERGRALYQKGC